MADHALSEETGKRFVYPDMAGTPHRPREEARVEQVQDRVFDTSDVLVDRQPGVGCLPVGGSLRPRRGEAGEIPGRVHEGIHGVSFTLGLPAALRTIHELPGRMAIEGISG